MIIIYFTNTRQTRRRNVNVSSYGALSRSISSALNVAIRCKRKGFQKTHKTVSGGIRVVGIATAKLVGLRQQSPPPKRGRNWRQLFDGRMRVQSMAVCSGSRSSSARRLSFAGWGDCVVIPHTGRSSPRTGSDPYGPRAGWRRPIRRTTHVTTGEGT